MRAANEGASGSAQPFVAAPSSSRSELGTSRLVHDYAVRPRVTNRFPAVLNNIGGAIRLVYNSEKGLINNKVVLPSRTNLIELEKHILDLSAVHGATQGIFYMLAVGAGDGQCVRLFESGSLVGLYQRSKESGILPNFITGHGYRVYNDDDIRRRERRKMMLQSTSKASKPRNRLGEVYTRELGHIKKHIQVLKGIAGEVCGDLPLQMFITIIRKNANANNHDHRYVHAFNVEPPEQQLLERAVRDFRLDGSRRLPDLEKLADVPLTMQEQLDVLCCLSNDPLQPHRTVSGTISATSTKIGYMRYLSYQLDGDDSPRMLPASIRNRFLYFRSNNRESQCTSLLNHAFEEPASDCTQPCFEAPQDDFPAVIRARKPTQPVLKITEEVLRGVRGPLAPSASLLQVRPYEHFRKALVEAGSIMWRLNTIDDEMFIMNDYNETGELMMNNFTEVRYSHRDGQARCTCETYGVIFGIATTRAEEDVLPVGILCMHCRFFMEEIHPRLATLQVSTNQKDLSALEVKLRQSMKYLNHPVVPLSKTAGLQKYSVRAENGTDCAIINISNTGIMALCTRGICQATQRHKRSVNGLLKLESASSLCPHLATLHANREVWAPDQPPDGTELEEEDVGPSNTNAQEKGAEMSVPSASSSPAFDPGTGKWSFGGYSSHRPTEEHDLNQIRNVQARMAVHDKNPTYRRDRETGCFTGMDLIPDIPKGNTCSCGSPFMNEQFPDGLPPVEDFTCTLYMRHAPTRCRVYCRRCLNDGCTAHVKYSGAEDSVFLWSKQVAAGDEVGWDFVNLVMASAMTFSSFCTHMTRLYKSANVISAPFMHKSTFVSWFFAWCGHMEIDFPQEIDPMCGYNPKYFRSRRLPFTGFNTEICEQFNSFLQCVKDTGTHLTQSHFTFFIQFMIFMWNKRKTTSFQRKVNLALAGHE